MTNPGLDELFRRAVDLNLRYYGAVGKLAADYLRDVAGMMGTVPVGKTPAPGTPPPPVAHLALEGAVGEVASGVFLVENSLPQDVQAPVNSSAFSDPAGRQVQPKVVFEPAVIVLKPGERTLVKASVGIGADLEPGVRYAGEFLIPQLQGTRIPVVIRRRA